MITISDVAAEKITQILKAEGMPQAGLRVHASAGSCCGPQYEISIDDKSGDGDTVVERNGAKLFVDKATAKSLDGAELGFISDERGEGFVLGFPNGAPAGGGCGCGPEAGVSGCDPGSGKGGKASGGCGCS